MSLRISVSRAARLVGVKRGTLQQKIRAGELKTFEGELYLSDLLQVYPNTTVDDSSMLDRVEQIMEQATFITSEPGQHKPSSTALASRVLAISQQLVKQQKLVQSHKDFIDILKYRLNDLELDGKSSEIAPARLKSFCVWIVEAIQGLENSETIISESFGNEVFLRIMTAQATIIPSGHEFFIEGADSILDAGLRGGLALNYGCSNGNCGLCKMRVVSGEIRKTKRHDFSLTDTEKGLGYILSCANTAVTDVVLEAEEAEGTFDIPQQSITLRVKKIEHPNSSVIIVNTRTPRTNRLRFLAGQQVMLDIDNIGSNTYFIASCPCDDMNLQFHIDSNADDAVSKYLGSNTKANDIISLTGPTGSFTLNENSPNSLVFIAEGNGFAPIKGLIEHAMALDSAENIYLYWLTDIEDNHYLNNLCRSWNDALDNFDYAKLTVDDSSKALDSVNSAIVSDHKSFKDLDFYICAEKKLGDKVTSMLDTHSVSQSHIQFATA